MEATVWRSTQVPISCVAASWKKGKRDGVACYDARSGQTIWHRPDLRRVQGLRFSALGEAIWCSMEGGPVRRLDARTGLTLATIRAVQDVVESPYSDHSLQLRRAEFSIEGAKSIRVPRLTFGMLDAAFSPDALCLTEAGGPVRCLDCDTASERWRYQPPHSHHVLRISSQADQSFYGVQWGYEHGGSVTLIRLSHDHGAFTEVCCLNSFPDACCFGADVVVTSAGDVVSLSQGKILRQLAFPQRDYPELPTPVREPPLHFAARFGTIKTIENLIAHGADVNLRDDAGSTPLHIAAMKGRLEVIRILLDAGADPRTPNGSGETPAQVAERAGHEEVVQCLKPTP